MFRSLRFKIVVFLIVANGLSFLAMNLISYEISNKRMNHQLERQSMDNLSNTVNNVYTLLSLRLSEATVLADSNAVRNGDISSRVLALAQNILAAKKPYAAYGIADPYGVMTMLNGSTKQVGAFPAFRQALAGMSSASDPTMDNSGKALVWLFIPLYDRTIPIGNVHDVAVFAVDSSQLFNGMLSVANEEYEDSSLTLVDTKLNVLHNPSDLSSVLTRRYLADSPDQEAFRNQLLFHEQGNADAHTDGSPHKLFYRKVPGYNWYAVLSVSKHEFEAPLRQTLWTNMALIGLAEITLGFFLYQFTRRFILGRLKQVVDATQQVASGDLYVQPIPPQTRDELGLLARSVNGMTEKLRDLFEPFHSIITHHHYAMIVTDDRFRVTSFNAQAVSMLGYQEREVLGERALPRWHDPKQLATRAEHYASLLKRPVHADETALFALAKHGLMPDTEWLWRTKDGDRLVVSINTSVMRHPDGSVKGYVLLARDVSENVRMAATNTRQLEIIENAHDMIGSFDVQGRMFYVNKAGLKFLGIDALNEDNDRLSTYLTIPNAVKFADGLEIARLSGYWQSETEFVRENGDIQHASMIVVAHHAHDGDETFYSTIVRDMTDRKQIERQLVQAKDAADEANEAKSTFLARMSHEIRTPLNGMIGLTYLLQKSELTALQQEYLRQISDSSHNLLHILNDVLDFSKLEADKLTLEHVPFRLGESLLRLSGMFAVLLGPKPVDFVINVDPSVPDELVGDPTRLEQVLLNLGSNAIKFTNVGMIELQIGLTERSDGQATLAFAIRDTGIGMTPAQRGKLFTPFVQADDKTSRKYGGTGLGLVISHTLVEKMGGKIEVESTHLVGTSFSFSLRFALGETASNAGSPAAPAFGTGPRTRVLVLEDQPLVAHNWRLMFEALGCDCYVAGRWEEASALLKEMPFDIAVLDMEAGDMHGEHTWAQWMEELRGYGAKAVSSTTLLGRDALQHVPDEVRPAAVLIKPAAPLQVRQMLRYLASGAEAAEPAKPADGGAGVPPRIAAGTRPNGGVAPGGRDVLVVDDQEINRIVARQLLQQGGYRVRLAASGDEGIAAVSEGKPDLVLMDIHMPEMDGHETTLRLRASYSPDELPILALTADVTEEQHAKSRASGMNDIITKPIDPTVLYPVLARWLAPIGGADTTPASEPGGDLADTPELQVGAALRRLSGKTALYRQLLDKFATQYADAADQLRRLLAEDDRGQAIRLAHSLSGASGHLGAAAMQEAAMALEQSLKAGRDGQDELAALSRASETTLYQIEQWIRQKSY